MRGKKFHKFFFFFLSKFSICLPVMGDVKDRGRDDYGKKHSTFPLNISVFGLQLSFKIHIFILGF